MSVREEVRAGGWLGAIERSVYRILTFRPDLMLLDIMFPVKIGFEVCQRVKGDPDTRGIKVVMLSAKGRDVEVAQALDLGADAFITKPFSTRELVAKVREMLDG